MHAIMAENWLVYHYWSSANVRFQARSRQASLKCLGLLIMPAAAAGHTLPATHGRPIFLLDKDMMSRDRNSSGRTCASTSALPSVPCPTLLPYPVTLPVCSAAPAAAAGRACVGLLCRVLSES